jgi:trigger factor
MQVSVEAGDGLVRQIKVDLPAESIEQEVDKRLRDFARSARLPGFRPGKVPLKLLRQRYGASVRGEVFGEQVQSSFPKAVAEAELRPVGVPDIEPDIDQAQGRYSYVAKFEVLPDIELATLSGQSIARPVAEVTEADVDAMIERLRQQHKTWSPVERPAADGDRVKLSFQGTVDGESFEGGTAEDVELELGSGRMISGFEAQLEGASAGDERVVDVTFPEKYHNSALAGKPARFAVQVKEVQAPELPALDADFVAAFGIADGDIDGFRADVRNNMERELAQRIKAKIKNQVMDLLLAVNPIDVPEALVAQEIETLKEQTRQSVGGGTFELPDEPFTDSARRRVSLGLIVGELVKRHNIQADQERVRATVQELAATYEDPQAVAEYYYNDANRLSSVRSLVLEERVVEHVMEEVDVTDQPTTFQDLTQSTETDR